MAARSSKGLRLFMSNGGAGVAKPITGITKAKNPVATVADTTGMSIGDPIYITQTQFAELDNKWHTVGAITPTSFVIQGVDTTSETASLGAGATAQWYAATDMVSLCLSGITMNPETPGTINVGTYCVPSATLPATAVSAGSATLNGYLDIADPGYVALLAAEADGKERVLQVMLPQSQGSIVFGATFSTVTYNFPLDGGIDFTANATLSQKPRHVFELV
jgi:hypothetical protein